MSQMLSLATEVDDCGTYSLHNLKNVCIECLGVQSDIVYTIIPLLITIIPCAASVFLFPSNGG